MEGSGGPTRLNPSASCAVGLGLEVGYIYGKGHEVR